MSYSVYADKEFHKQTSKTAVSPVSVPPAVQLGSTVAAYLLVALSTSAPAPSAITCIKRDTANIPIFHQSAFSAKETDREDLLAIARIRAFNTYKPEWAGSGSIAPARNTIEQAEEFARYLFNLGKIHTPYISASGDGEINFYWKKDSFIFDLGFTGDSSYSYYAYLPDGQEVIEDGASLGSPLPREIVDFIIRTT